MLHGNLRHFNVFLQVARRGSGRAAAHAVNLSQPAVTQALLSIEKFFGCQLLQRGGSGTSLTPAGDICAARIERALAHIQAGVESIVGIELKFRRASTRAPERRMTAAQLRALCAITEHGSFTRAAAVLQISKPTLHRAARQLEESCAAALFEKTSFGVRPTRDAEKLAIRIRLAHAEVEQARAEVNAMLGTTSGATVIGAMPLARSMLVPKALIEFTAAQPDHHVSIVEGAYESLLTNLRSGQIDFLIGALRKARALPDVVQEHLFDDPLAIILRVGHPLAQRKSVSTSVLCKFAWVAPRLNSPLRAQFNELFTAAGLSPPAQIIECNSLSASRSLLLESDRLMLLSASQIHYERRVGLLTTLPHPRGYVVRSIGLTTRRDWQPTAVQSRLLSIIRGHARASRSGG